MSTRIAINGFGRIGRTFLRVLLSDPDASKGLDVVAINMGDLDAATIVHLFKYDTTMGVFQQNIQLVGNHLLVGNYKIRVIATSDVSALPWRDLAIDWVVDCSGQFTEQDAAYQHIRAGAKRVLISAPASGAECTIIPGVNAHAYDASQHLIVSLGSCTTNALLPLLKVVSDQVGIEAATAVTVHAYTNTQSLLDGGATSSKDLRRHRAAPMNIVPSTTGAERLVGTILPQLNGKVSAMSVRVPVANVSFLELSFVASQDIERETVDGWFEHVSKNAMKSIISVTREQLVSSDFLGDEHSVIYDATLTLTKGRLGTIFGWYDNEWGYSCRMRDFLESVR